MDVFRIGQRVQFYAKWTLELLSVLHYLSLFFICNIIAFPIFLRLLFSSFVFVPILYMIWMYFDLQTPYRAGRRFWFLRKMSIWKYMASYFPIKLYKTSEIDPFKNYMFCFHPHGIIGCGGFVNFATEANNFSKLFPGITLHPLTLEINFYMPLFRDYLMGLGLGVVSRESINFKLTKLGPGHSVMIVVGGASEAVLADPEHPYRLKLMTRKGFIREALMAGASLVPTFSFGENEILYQINPSPSSMIKRLQDLVRHLFRFVPIIFYGNHFLLPLRKPIITVVGTPLKVPLTPCPTEKEIDNWHAKYIVALRSLFSSYKERFGCSDKELELL